MEGLGLRGLEASYIRYSIYIIGHKGEHGSGISLENLKFSGATLGAKEKVGGVKVENQKLELLHSRIISKPSLNFER
jgi:hypothetical protein